MGTPPIHRLRFSPLTHGCAVLSAIACACWISSSTFAVDRVILRNLDIKSGKAVTSFDEDGVRLDEGPAITWDNIERGILARDQARFDALLQEVGEPLYRIRQRLQVEDYAGCLEHAEKLAPRFAARRSPSAYMVSQSLMWALLATGQRERALVPYLRCYELLREVEAAAIPLPGERRLVFDKTTGLTSELLPIWFDAPAAKDTMPLVLAALRSLSKPLPEGARVYFATLAYAAGEAERGIKLLEGLESEHPQVLQWRELCLLNMRLSAETSDRSADQLERILPRLSGAHRAFAYYCLGRAKGMASAEDVRQSGVLDLLRIPASYETSTPELAAAAVYAAMLQMEENHDTAASTALRRELLSRYGHTYHAARAQAGQREKTDS